jgi:hypothetical protein
MWSVHNKINHFLEIKCIFYAWNYAISVALEVWYLSIRPEDGGSTFVQKVDNFLQDLMVSQPRRMLLIYLNII